MLSELQKNLDNNTKSEQNNEFCFVRFLCSIREIMEKNLSYLTIPLPFLQKIKPVFLFVI